MSKEQDIVHILDIPFINKTKRSFLEEKLYPHLLKEEKSFVVTANPEIVMATRKNEAYRQAVCSADYIVPDGIGIVMAAKRQKTPLYERIAGYDLMIDLLTFANKNHLSCFLLGATDSVNEKAANEINRKYPNVKIAGQHHGYFTDDDEIFHLVKQAKPDLIFVALGYPKQELWIKQYLPLFDKGLFIGVGGSLDVLAGDVKRAPELWITLNLEWLYRTIKQPSRIGRLGHLIKFMFISFFNKH